MKATHVLRRTVRTAAVGVSLVFALFLFMGAGNPGSAAQGLATLRQMQDAFHVVAAKVVPAVVEIHVVDIQQVPVVPNPFDFFNNRGNPNNGSGTREFRQAALGSGVMIERRGNTVYVLTNNHVAGSAAEIKVQLSDKREFPARLVGKDENKDLALISFTTNDQVPLAELGDSDSVQPGDWVLAIGNPLGFTGTLTAGIVSAVGRDSAQTMGASGFTDYIQTDAAINQGNSGGALVNIAGQVVGINTWIASPSGGNVGLGFAIPINNAKKDINDFITKGKVDYGWLGVTIGDATPALVKDMHLTADGGALVSGLFLKGPAAQAGLRPGDYVTAMNGTPVKNTAQFLHMIGNLAPGQSVEFRYLREGRTATARATLAVRADAKTLAAQNNMIWPGFSAAAINADVRSALNLGKNQKGIVVVDVPNGSLAERSGLRSGDVITAVAGHPTVTMSAFYKNLNAGGSTVALSVDRSNRTVTIVLAQ
jgi:Do/DeqQ family serine protease